MGGELLTDNIRSGNHRRSRSRSVSRHVSSRGRGVISMTGRGGSVSAKDIKILDLSAMNSPPSPTEAKHAKTTVATEFSGSTEDSKLGINRASGRIHQQQKLDRGRSRSQSRPRDRESVVSNIDRHSRSRSIPRPNTHKDSTCLSTAKALLERMEHQETAKTAAPHSRGRSAPRNRPDETGKRIKKLMDDVNRHRSRSRPQQQQQQRIVSRSHSRPPSSNNNHVRSSRSNSRPRENRSENRHHHHHQQEFESVEDRRRLNEKGNAQMSPSSNTNDRSQRRHSLHQSVTSHGDKRGKEHVEKKSRKHMQVEKEPLSMQKQEHKQQQQQRRGSSKLSSSHKHRQHQHDRDRSSNKLRSISADHQRNHKSNLAATYRSKSPIATLQPKRQAARSKSPFQEQKNNSCIHDDDGDGEDEDSSSSSCSSARSSFDSDGGDNEQSDANNEPRKVDKNGCCAYHPYIQLQKRTNGGKWKILSRHCVKCRIEAQNKDEEKSLIYVPSGSDELNPQRNGSGPLMIMNQGSVPTTRNDLVPRKPAGEENSLTASALESEGEGSDDDVTSVSSRSSSTDDYGSDEGDDVEGSEVSSVDSMGDLRRAGRRKTSTNNSIARSAKTNKSIRSTRSAERPIDMSKVESALQKIRSMGDVRNLESAPNPTTEIATGKHQPPPQGNRSPLPTKSAPESSTPQQQQRSRPPPPPPPPPPSHQNARSMSMAVLNTHPKPEFEGSEDHMHPPAPHNCQPQMYAPSMHHMHPPVQHNYQLQCHAPETHAPNLNRHQVLDDKEWMKYTVKCTAKENEDGSKKKDRRNRRASGNVPNKFANHEIRTHLNVKNMPFMDPLGDYGMYTGQVNENGRPDGKGSMKYDNGIFYEGTWTNGCQDEKAMSQYDRIRGGFTSWGGKGKVAVKSGRTMPWNAHKIDKNDENDKTNVRGMEWVDLNGDSGRYTGEVNKDELPHGRGMMKYSFGLVAEGEWVNGVLKENPHDRLIAATSMAAGGGAMSVISSARSLAHGGGIPVGPAMGCGMSVAQGSVYGSMPQMMQQQLNPMMMTQQPINPAQQHGMIAQQNAIMKSMMLSHPVGVYGGGGSVYGPATMIQIPPQQQQMLQIQQQQQMLQMQRQMMPMQQQQQMMPVQQQQPDSTPPVAEIRLR